MKSYGFLILILAAIIGCSSQASSGKLGYTIQSHAIKVDIDPGRQLATVQDSVILQSDSPRKHYSFLMNSRATIKNIRWENHSIEYTTTPDIDFVKYFGYSDSTLQENYKDAVSLDLTLPQTADSGMVVFDYAVQAADSVNAAAFSREYIAYEVKGYIGEKGVFISPSFLWYPSLPQNLPTFRVTVSCPDSFNILTQGKLANETETAGKRISTWITGYPTDGIHLVGAHYGIQTEKYKDVNVSTYFFPNSQELAASYLSACQRYLGMYEGMIGKYPFSKFAVVENFFPTGYGMPSYTLLGSQVIRLPFIIYTSLGHEITHNWWGNSVYVDYETGNWCEGLTTYYADYHYKEMRGPEEAMQYRRDIDRDFTVYVKEEKDFPLSEFEARTESSSRAIGYGKSAMVFHQLRRIIGDSLFYQSFREFYRQNIFREASWHDIRESVEKVSGEDLKWFFDQWVQRKGAPEISLGKVQKTAEGITVEVKQSEPTYLLYLPVRVTTAQGDTVHNVWFNEAGQKFSFAVEGNPLSVAIDPDFDVFRKLDRNEIPPTLSAVFAGEEAIVVLPDNVAPEQLQAYRKFAGMLVTGEEDLEIVKAEELQPEQMNTPSLYLLGTPSENSAWSKVRTTGQEEIRISDDAFSLNGKSYPGPDDVFVSAFRVEDNPDQNICAVAIGSNGQTGRVGLLLKHYGKYSYLVFENGKNVVKGVFTAHRSPLVYQFQ